MLSNLANLPATAVLAVGWEPELRGLLTVIIAVAVLCGSVYLLLGTNMGARLGFLVALTGLFGWMVLMGILWWIYGIGLIGEDPSWRQVEGRTVIQNTTALRQAGVIEARPEIPPDADPLQESVIVRQVLADEGWTEIAEADFGQAATAAGNFLQDTGAFDAGEFRVTALYDIGGDRWPKINESLDFVAFFHTARFALAEVAPLEELRTEPGRAPVQPQIDPEGQRQYVYMVRDLGSRRLPSALLTIGSGMVFLSLCWMLHRRDRIVAENRKAELVPAG
jgi:hypothetical protein